MKRPPFASETSIRDLLTSVASAHDGHGAVSAAAVAGAIGTSLLLFVASLPNSRSDAPDEGTAIVAAATALAEVQEQLLETIETDTAVKLFAARNMPQASERERTDRHAAIQFALRAAAEVPLEVMRLCARALQSAQVVAERSPRPAFTDIQLALSLLHASFDGARSNLEDKLGSLTDAAYMTAVVDEIARLNEDAATTARAAASHLQVPPA